MSSPRVSVLIPTFNRAEYLLTAVNSALEQTFSDIEVIIVDDGSTDNTAQIVRGIKDPRVRYIHQENSGVSAALNTAWRAAGGEYLARLDSDDMWLPTLLDRLMPALDSDPGLGLIYARAQWMDAHGRLLPQVLGAPEKFPGQTLKSLLYGDYVTPMAVVFRKECVESVGGYDESLIANEDWDLWIRMAEHAAGRTSPGGTLFKRYRFAYVPEVLAYYRVHPENLTRAGSVQNRRLIQDRIRVLERYYARPDVPAEALAIKRLAFRNLYQDIAMRHLSAGRWGEALDSYAQAVRVAPDPLAALVRGIRDVVYNVFLAKTRLGVRLADAWVELEKRRQR